MTALLDRAVALASPWASAYNDSTALETAVTFVHFAGLLVAGGFALAADRSTLRALKQPADARAYQLSELHAIHRPVLIGLAATIVSGVLMFAADLRTFAASYVFWTKMALLVLLLVNGLRMTRAERRARAPAAGPKAPWGALRGAAYASMTLWLLLLLFGTLLPTVGS